MPVSLSRSGAGLALVVALLAVGCAPKTRPATFYLLQPIARMDMQAATATNPALIGVGPVDIPAYLDRPQIVTGGGGSQLHLDEYQRWAEPLRDNVTRVLAENLSVLIPPSHVLAFPWNRAIAPDYQVEIQIGRLHVDAAGNSELKANWSILKQHKPLVMKAFHTQIPVAGNDYEAKVAAQSQALAAFSRAIAVDLQELMEKR